MSLPASFPSALDALANPTPTTNRDDAGFELDLVVGRIHDIIEALEAKVGIGASLPAAGGGVLRMTAAGASQWGKIATADVAADQLSLMTSASGTSSNPQVNVAHGTVAVPETAIAQSYTAGEKVLVLFDMSWVADTINAILTLGLTIDGGGAVMARSARAPAPNIYQWAGFQYLWTVPTTASHTLQPTWATDTGWVTALATQRTLRAIRLLR